MKADHVLCLRCHGVNEHRERCPVSPSNVAASHRATIARYESLLSRAARALKPNTTYKPDGTLAGEIEAALKGHI